MIGIPFTPEGIAALDRQIEGLREQLHDSGTTVLDGIRTAVEQVIPLFDAAGWPREAIGAIIAGSLARTVPTLPTANVVVYALYVARNLPGATHVDLPPEP